MKKAYSASNAIRKVETIAFKYGSLSQFARYLNLKSRECREIVLALLGAGKIARLTDLGTATVSSHSFNVIYHLISYKKC